MFSSFSLPFKIPGFSSSSSGAETLGFPPVKEYEIETDTEKRARTLKHLLKANHANYSIIYNHLRFHNHTPHVLGSAYILGATSEQLTHVYDEESKTHEPWKESPNEITKDDWRDFLGQRKYQRAYIDFFEDQLVAFGYDWKALLEYYLYEGKEPLVNSLVSGLGHPLIHLGYAYELNSREVAIEALGLGACFYDSLHKYSDDASYTKPGSYKTSSVIEILSAIASDSRLDNLLDHPGADNIPTLLQQREAVILDHWNSWDISTTNPTSNFYEAQRAAAALLAATPPAPHPSDGDGSDTSLKYYDFFLLHLLTTTHAIRILLPLVRTAYRIPLMRQWLLFTILAYTAQLRPKISLTRIADFDVQERGWKYVNDKALNGKHNADAHFVKGCRALQVAEDTWGKRDGFWLKAAVKFASQFKDWGGFATRTEGYQPKDDFSHHEHY